MIAQKDLQGIIALAIKNNKQAFINAMRANGYPVAAGISEEDLYQAAGIIFSKKGINGLASILNFYPTSSFSTSEQKKILNIFGLEPNLASKCDWTHPLDCVTGAVDWATGLVGGTSTTNTTPTVQTQTQTSAPPLSPFVLGITVVAGILGIILFRKFTAVVVGIIVIVFGIVLYGIFAKTVTTSSSSTSGTTSTNTVGGWGSFLSSLVSIIPFV